MDDPNLTPMISSEPLAVSLKAEIVRNFLGFALLGIGVLLVHLGTHFGISKEADAGIGFLGMAGLALSVRHSPST